MTPALRRLLLGCLLAVGLVQESRQLVIKSITVPATVKAGDTDYVILDCDYDLQDTPPKGLVVKWFFDDNQVAYQWIHGRKPQASELTNNYIDLAYKASDDPHTMYRAMKLNNPGVNLTGEYTCVISTFVDERTANASMVVYSTEDKFDLVYRKKTIDDRDGVEITCLAEGLYPMPTLDISVEGVSEKQAAKPSVTLRDDGLYDILSRTALLDEDMSDAAIVKCLLSIPKANYNVSRKTVYYPGISTTASVATTKLLGKTDTRDGDAQPGTGGGTSLAVRSSFDSVFLLTQLIIFGVLFVI